MQCPADAVGGTLGALLGIVVIALLVSICFNIKPKNGRVHSDKKEDTSKGNKEEDTSNGNKEEDTSNGKKEEDTSNGKKEEDTSNGSSKITTAPELVITTDSTQ